VKSKVFINPTIRFIFSSIGLYLLWYFIYELWIKPDEWLDLLIMDNIVYWNEKILKLFGYILIREFPVKDIIRTTGIDGTVGVWIGARCDGVSLFALFSGFVIAYPGQLVNKLIFIPLGILSIHIINIIRVVILCIIQHIDYTLLDFNHNYTFTSIMYTYIFILWYIWISKFTNYKINN